MMRRTHTGTSELPACGTITFIRKTVNVTKKEIAERATKALHLFENSKPNEISVYDLTLKVNEALRLIKELAIEDSPSIQ
jgi:hypothetical protein